MNNSSTSPGASDVPLQAVLGALIVAAAAANLYLLTVVLYARSLRRRSVYKLLVNAGAANLLDVLLNLSFSLYYALSGRVADDTLCQVSVFFLRWLDDVHVLNLLLLAIERAVSVHLPRTHRKRFREGTCLVLVGLAWLLSFVMSVVVPAVDVPELRATPWRFACSLRDGVTIIYTFISLVAFFLLPFCTTVGVYIAILRVALRENDDEEADGPVPSVFRELSMSKLTASASGAWILLVGPYTVKYYIDAIKRSNFWDRSAAVSATTASWTTPDTVLLYLRHSFPLCLPLLCVAWRRDVRRKSRHLLCPTRGRPSPPGAGVARAGSLNPLHTLGSPGRPIRANGTAHAASDLDSVNSLDYDDDEEEVAPERLRPPSPPNIPVLFATSEGLHVQTDAPPLGGGLDSAATARVIKCDVDAALSSGDLRRAGDDDDDDDDERTSDYASNRDSDAYQRSNPISVRSAAAEAEEGSAGRRRRRHRDGLPGEVRAEGQDAPPPATERCIDAEGSPGAPAGADGRKRRKGRVERTERQEVGADLEVARAPASALYSATTATGQGPAPAAPAPEPKERKPRRKRHKRTPSSSDVAPAPVYSTQVSKDSTASPPNLSESNGSAQASDLRRARRRDRPRSDDAPANGGDAFLKPPRRLEPLEVSSNRGSDKEEGRRHRGAPEEKPRKKRRKKKSSTDPAPMEVGGLDLT